MDLETYKKNKLKQAAEAKAKDEYHRVKCKTCYRGVDHCLCKYARPFETKVHFVILMHIKEAKKEKVGTGRLAAACLKNSQIIVGIDFTEDRQVNNLLNDPQYFPMILYPGDDAYNISEECVSKFQLPEGKTPLVFVIDGTWPCAKKMMRESKNLHDLPRICFSPTKKSLFSIKHQPHDFCLSTIESIHFLLDEMDRVGIDSLEKKHDNLLDVFKEMVDFQIKCASDPNKQSYRRGESIKGYKTPEQRTRGKKKSIQKIIFKG